MATNTYVALDTKTIGTAVSSVTFSSIPSGYTDLVLVATAQGASGSPQNLLFQVNGDTGTNYSSTWLTGNGTAASSSRLSTRTNGLFDIAGYAPIGSNYNNVIAQFNNYSNSTTNKTILSRANSAATGVDAVVSLWRNTAAITSITIYFSSNNIAVGSTFTIYGIANASVGAKATGGIISSDSQYYYHTFIGNGTFTPTQSLTCDYLVVAGGAGGGGGNPNNTGGGGGAGGLRSTVGATGGGGSLETPLSLTATAYTVTVGAGGAGGVASTTQPPMSRGTNGSNSVFSTITSTGGGGGGASGNTIRTGASGGSGGGGTGNGGTNAGGAGTTNQGYAGGEGRTDEATYRNTGGGGGAGAAGGVIAVGVGGGGTGGTGIATSISGTSTFYAGGGGGSLSINNGGNGGGGQGSVSGSTPGAGAPNTGGGGGGGSLSTTNGGAGGSGIVIIRYAK